MAGAVVRLISAFLTIVRYIAEYAQQQKWIDAATTAIILKNVTESDDAIARAQAARELVRARGVSDPDSVLRDDDGFKRPDDKGGV